MYGAAKSEYKQLGLYEACRSLCPSECHSFSFSISALYFRLPDGGEYPEGYAELNVCYESFYYTVVAQEARVTLDGVLGTVGGLCGLFLGVSFVTFGEIVGFLVSVVRILISSNKGR